MVHKRMLLLAATLGPESLHALHRPSSAVPEKISPKNLAPVPSLLLQCVTRDTRPFRRFIPPATVWVLTAILDYFLWRKSFERSPEQVFSLEDGNLYLRWTNGGSKGIAVNRGHLVCFHFLLLMALVSHTSVMTSDPGFCRYPPEVVSMWRGQLRRHTRWCHRCDAPKPPRAHHCSRCGACVARMDHHCIYAANCVGAGNQKQFLLLLLYSTTSAAYANFLYFGTGALHCHSSTGNREANLADSAVASLSKGFGEALLAFGRCATWLGAALVLLFCWLTALLGVQLYGVVVDAGTIDRMQRFAISKSRGTELVTPWKAANQPEGVEPRKREGRKMAEGMPASLRSSNASPGPASVDVVIETGVGRIPHAAVSRAYSHSNEPTELSSSAMGGSRMDAIGGNHGFPSRDGNGAFAARDGEDAGHPATNSAGGCNSSRWRAFRQEVLGEGPWWMWFIPLPAKHDPDVEKRVYEP